LNRQQRLDLEGSRHLSERLIHPGLKVLEEEVTRERPLCHEHIQVLIAPLKDSEPDMGTMFVKELPPQLPMVQKGCRGLGMQHRCLHARWRPASVKHQW
jgi:hypothetical protein